MESRKDFIADISIKCLDEMYRKSQPSITWAEMQELWKENPNRQIWREHYLPQFMYNDIIDKYMRVYRIGEEWSNNINLLIDYLTKGGSKDVYIPEKIDAYTGDIKPAHRSYVDVPPIKEQILNILKKYLGDNAPQVGDDLMDCIMNTINDCKTFFKFDRYENSFKFVVADQSPCSNIKLVQEFYKDNPDIIINEINEEEEEDE